MSSTKGTIASKVISFIGGVVLYLLVRFVAVTSFGVPDNSVLLLVLILIVPIPLVVVWLVLRSRE